MQYDDWTATASQLEEARQAAKASMDSQSPEEWVDRFGDEPRKGADILVQSPQREGAHRVFAYPGAASMEIHQALTRSNLVKNTLCRHEQVSMRGLFHLYVDSGEGAMNTGAAVTASRAVA